MMRNTPPMLRKMMETPVGDLVVYGDRIMEPRTGCCVGRDFPSKEKAIEAAKAMNEVADWPGIIKTRAEGRSPNCQDELRRIAENFGGKIADGGRGLAEQVCQLAAAKIDSALPLGDA